MRSVADVQALIDDFSRPWVMGFKVEEKCYFFMNNSRCEFCVQFDLEFGLFVDDIDI